MFSVSLLVQVFGSARAYHNGLLSPKHQLSASAMDSSKVRIRVRDIGTKKQRGQPVDLVVEGGDRSSLNLAHQHHHRHQRQHQHQHLDSQTEGPGAGGMHTRASREGDDDDMELCTLQ